MNNKKYIPVNDISQSKNDINSQNIQGQKILFDTSSSNEIELYKQESSGMNEKKIYILANDDCKIWHTSKIKCISYHGLELFSLYHPLNDRKNLYIQINKITFIMKTKYILLLYFSLKSISFSTIYDERQ